LMRSVLGFGIFIDTEMLLRRFSLSVK